MGNKSVFIERTQSLTRKEVAKESYKIFTMYVISIITSDVCQYVTMEDKK